MTDPDRSAASVEELFAAIRALLAVHPEWRVGQALVNALDVDVLFYAENRDAAR